MVIAIMGAITSLNTLLSTEQGQLLLKDGHDLFVKIYGLLHRHLEAQAVPPPAS